MGAWSMESRQAREKSIRLSFLLTASVSILVLFLILVFLFVEGLPVFKKVSLPAFLFGRDWSSCLQPRHQW